MLHLTENVSRIQAIKLSLVASACGVAALVLAKYYASRTRAGKHELKDISTNCQPKRPATGNKSLARKERHRHTRYSNPTEASPTQSVDVEDINAAVNDTPQSDRLGVGEVLRWFKSSRAQVDDGQNDPNLPGKQKVYVDTYGCAHNRSDGEYMMGQLREYGYTLVDSIEDCDACVINSCTVKTPTEAKALSVVGKAQEMGKRVVLAGCVPAGDRNVANNALKQGVSVIDVTQLDRIVEVVEETIKGNTVNLLKKRRDLPSLALPKIRRDRFVEIITINAGCLGNCSYCKTKMSRGKVVSYPIDTIIERAKQAASEGVRMIELASEDMGAYGLDIGTNIGELLLKLSDALPPGVMLKTGMTNPPYIMEHIDIIIQALKRPNVHAFMHIPVQSGSNKVLSDMIREYTIEEFTHLVDRLKEAIPDIFLVTDIICGFPTERPEDWVETMNLVKKYKFHGINISQFYARPGTAAQKLKLAPESKGKGNVGKLRYKELADFITSFNRYDDFKGRTERVWFTGTHEKNGQTLGSTKAFAKVFVQRDDSLIGRTAMVRIEKTAMCHVEGVVIGDIQ